MISAIRRGSLLDRFTMTGALLAISAPVYWLGLVALYLFSRDIGAIPIFAGAGTYTPLTENPFAWFDSLLLPWLVLAAGVRGVLRAHAALEPRRDRCPRTTSARRARRGSGSGA